MGRRGHRAHLVALLLVAAAAAAQDFHIYVGQTEAESVLLAWGKSGGSGNTIGRSSTSYGKATVTVGGRSVVSDRNWAVIGGLEPDTAHPYEIVVDGRSIGKGTVRTFPRQARRLAFFVIGDFGNGSAAQRAVAKAMWEEFTARPPDDPVRFVLTTGDNIYAREFLGIPASGSGNSDHHWRERFFLPYEPLLRHIPFCPSPGNHDGNESERRGDLEVYLDNFFFPRNEPARYYKFGFGGLAEFFSLDTTQNTTKGPDRPFYLESGEQFQWLRRELPASRARWKIPYFHHPLFTAGPEHPPMRQELDHFLKLFAQAAVKVVFNGHEHNFQFSEASPGPAASAGW